MAYSDYGAFVWKNGVRQEDKEDVPIFDAGVELAYPHSFRVFANIINNKNNGRGEWWQQCHHGVLGDGAIRVGCYKQGFPSVWKRTQDGSAMQIPMNDIVELCGSSCEGVVEYDGEKYFGYDYSASFSIDGYTFEFFGDSRRTAPGYHATMIEPDGTVWKCSYDYGFGAGFCG